MLVLRHCRQADIVHQALDSTMRQMLLVLLRLSRTCAVARCQHWVQTDVMQPEPSLKMAFRWCMDDEKERVVVPMENVAVRDSRLRAGDSEKITINLGPVDLGQIDLLVQEGFYANRTDLIRTAIRNQLHQHREAIQQSVIRRSLVLGLQHYSRADLEAARDGGQQLQIQVLGLASIGNDVSPELALAAIHSITVLGALHASPAVKAALAERIH